MEKKILVGLIWSGKDGSAAIPALWDRFLPLADRVPHRVNDWFYGLCFGTEEELSGTGFFSYMAGVETADADDIPMALCCKVLPAGHYAVFSHVGPVSEIKNTYKTIFAHWEAHTDAVRIKTYDFEFYGSKFTGPESPDSVVDIYIPIQTVPEKGPDIGNTGRMPS